MTFIGINIDALTVIKVATLRSEARMAKVAAHQGRALETLKELLVEPEFSDGDYFGVSGRLTCPRVVVTGDFFTREPRGPGA